MQVYETCHSLNYPFTLNVVNYAYNTMNLAGRSSTESMIANMIFQEGNQYLESNANSNHP